ncbi:PREDICTED: proteasomal ubiquitin receptor ADRM1 homolog isoform X2 [Eufriesea mexicana]|uniref:proteasomal ubiquitin receptor ADRM1 homolog isoform X2 n=1 Tax=Eufriesea mexicana TaxID=516756 RepID=UPI00083BE3FC|nr:PREDICTED: proteasomal ubiquitin receptor ADRM1 homolog isoform X2 [Eufriesea mexicana]
MSGGALFGNNASRGTPKNLVEFKAGKMTMKGKMVYPDIRKGQLYVYQSDDSLMHFCWKDRVSGYVEDDLIIFPDDCEFKHVPQCKTGRVYLLRFKSSNKKFFVWLQDLKTDKDEEYCRKINEVLNNPPTPGSQRSSSTNPEGDLQNLLNNMSQQQLMQLFGGVGQIGLGNLLGTMNRSQGVQTTRASTTTALTRVTTNTRPTTQMVSSPASTNESPKPNGDNKSSSKTSGTSSPGSASTNNKILLSDLQNFLSDIPTSTGTESVVQSGQAGPVIRQFGLGPDAVNAAASGNIEEFVTALESEAKSGQEQTQEGQEDKSTKQAPSTASPDKKGDDDEGLDLD